MSPKISEDSSIQTDATNAEATDLADAGLRTEAGLGSAMRLVGDGLSKSQLPDSDQARVMEMLASGADAETIMAEMGDRLTLVRNKANAA